MQSCAMVTRRGSLMSMVTPEGDWYLVQTSSSAENKVKINLEQRVKVMGMTGEVFEVLVPEQEVEAETPKGKKKIVKKQIYPGYVLVRMLLNDRSWAMVRNTQVLLVSWGKLNIPLLFLKRKSRQYFTKWVLVMLRQLRTQPSR